LRRRAAYHTSLGRDPRPALPSRGSKESPLRCIRLEDRQGNIRTRPSRPCQRKQPDTSHGHRGAPLVALAPVGRVRTPFDRLYSGSYIAHLSLLTPSPPHGSHVRSSALHHPIPFPPSLHESPDPSTILLGPHGSGAPFVPRLPHGCVGILILTRVFPVAGPVSPGTFVGSPLFEGQRCLTTLESLHELRDP